MVNKDGTNKEQAASSNTVHVVYNGPLYLRGDLAIEGVEGDGGGAARTPDCSAN